MTDEARTMRELILAYDDLDDAERRRVDAFLDGHPRYRETLERLRAVERAPDPDGDLDLRPGPAETDPMSPAERRAEEASLAALRRQLGLRETGAAGEAAGGAGWRQAWARVVSWRVFMPVVAAAAATIVLLRPSNEAGPWESVFVTRPIGVRGTGGASPVEELRTGDRFVVAFELTEPAFVVAVHVDSDGQVALLWPDTPAGAQAPWPAGRTHVVPPSASEHRWSLSGEAGSERILVAAFSSAPDLESLDRRLDSVAPELTLSSATSATRAILEAASGTVRVVDVLHRP